MESIISFGGAEESEEVRRWSEGMEAVACRLDKYFVRSEGRERLRDYLRGLLSPAERKNSWQLAEAVGDETPYGIQHLLGRAVWSADQVRDDLLCYVQESLADEEGILVIDETGFLKKGDKSVGVARQYSGTAGRIENSQIGVFAAYVSPWTWRSAHTCRSCALPAVSMDRRSRALPRGRYSGGDRFCHKTATGQSYG